MTKFTVSQNGKTVSDTHYTWDETTKTFYTDVEGLDIDFSGIHGVTFKVGKHCNITTGSNCVFITGSYCTFKTTGDCIFTTGSYCKFTTESSCMFKTYNNCEFNIPTQCVVVTAINSIIRPISKLNSDNTIIQRYSNVLFNMTDLQSYITTKEGGIEAYNETLIQIEELEQHIVDTQQKIEVLKKSLL